MIGRHDMTHPETPPMGAHKGPHMVQKRLLAHRAKIWARASYRFDLRLHLFQFRKGAGREQHVEHGA